MRRLYTILLYVATPFVLLRLLLRSRRNPAYRRRWAERFAFIPPAANKSIWLHSVSLGETIAATPLIKALLEAYPQYTIVITTMTPSGSAHVTKQFGDRVMHTYVPYDLPSVVNRFLKRTKPAIAIIMETELWPNLIHCLRQQHIPIMIANARLSQRSCKGYQRIRTLARQMMESITIVAAQSPLDGEHFKALGLSDKQLLISGNIKFDIDIPETLKEDGQKLKDAWHQRPSFVAASTHEGEEAIILQAFKKIRAKHSDALLILVPRHPERFDKIAQLCQKEGYQIARRSLKQLPDDNTAIFLGDTLGELKLFYAAADVAFVGGSFVPVGGHNLIEPAALGLPVISGPHLHNFLAVKALLENANALTLANNAEELAAAVNLLFSDHALKLQLGERALAVSLANTGALQKHLNWISEKMSYYAESSSTL